MSIARVRALRRHSRYQTQESQNKHRIHHPTQIKQAEMDLLAPTHSVPSIYAKIYVTLLTFCSSWHLFIFRFFRSLHGPFRFFPSIFVEFWYSYRPIGISYFPTFLFFEILCYERSFEALCRGNIRRFVFLETIFNPKSLWW